MSTLEPKARTKKAAKKTGKKTAKAKPRSRDAKVYCVVCPTWEIKHPERCSNTVVLSPRRTLYFCQRRCKDRYLKAPEAF